MNIFDGSSDCRVAMSSIGCMRRLVSYVLLALTGLLFVFSGREMVLLGMIICLPAQWNEHAFWSHIYNLFMALEFIFMIIKYFEENYHFPLRYILYIGVTSVARSMMIDHEHLVPCGTAILLLVLAYCLVTARNALAARFLPEEPSAA
jgi:protein PsiE